MVVLPGNSAEVQPEKLAETLNRAAEALNALAVYGSRIGNKALWGDITEAQNSVLRAWARERGL
jgi:hypothetical protein